MLTLVGSWSSGTAQRAERLAVQEVCSHTSAQTREERLALHDGYAVATATTPRQLDVTTDKRHDGYVVTRP